MAFAHLHLHSEHSKLDGGCQIKEIAARAEEIGCCAVALTDHGNMQGLAGFYTAMKETGVKPILGCEIYLTDDRHDKRRETKTYHLTLIAETTEGYENLCKISSYAFLEGLFVGVGGGQRARADYEILERHAKGIICLTGCMAAPTMHHIFQGDISRARQEVERLVQIFGKDNVYGEIQNVGITERIPAFSELSFKLGRATAEQHEEYLAHKDEWAAAIDGMNGRTLRANRTRLSNLLEKEYSAELEQQVKEAEAQLAEFERLEALLNPTVSLTQNEANAELAEIAKEVGIKLVATGDVHYLREGDAEPHDAMVCIGIGKMQKDDKRFSLLPKKYYMRSEEEMRALLPDWPEAIDNTVEIAERCTASITWGKELLPKYPLPDGFDDPNVYLRHLCEEALKDLVPNAGQEYIDRLNFELETITNMGFPDYFLITWDLFAEAARRGIPSGPGRGSAAGSLVAYCLGITQLDPLEYDLLFERFLNPGRKSMPDIDMDFAPVTNGGRPALIEYARKKYNGLAGVDTAVAQIITFGRFAPRGALKSAAKVLADPAEELRAKQEKRKAPALVLGDKLAKFVPDKPGMSFKKALDPNEPVFSQELQRVANGETTPQEKEAFELATWLEGFVANNSIHAAAVIIGDHPLENDIPLQRLGDDQPLTTQYDMVFSEKIGLLKMDFLGLRNLDVIDETLRRIKHVRGIDFGTATQFYRKVREELLWDEKTYELFARGDTVGTFQFESSGMREALRSVKPTEFRDLIALVALYRPGPMGYIPHYAARKNGREKLEYLHPSLEPILKETWGITVYQEQSMRIARELAGFSPAEADDLRKAIGKKKLDLMMSIKPNFIEGGLKNGISKKVLEQLWADNEKAAEYSFNKSHAACYAFVSYITGYLKAHYPNEYMASLLSSVMSKKDKPREYLSEAKRMGVRVLPPDVNRSLRDFSVQERDESSEEYDVLFGLNAMKAVGAAAAEEIRAEVKRSGPFVSLHDFVRRMPHMGKLVQQLIKGGAFDWTGETRKAMAEAADEIVKREKDAASKREKEFLKAIKARYEETLSPATAAGEQETLFADPLAAVAGDSDDFVLEFAAEALNVEPKKPAKAKKTPKPKLTDAEKKGIDAAGKASYQAHKALEEGALAKAILVSLDKAAENAAKRQVKVEMAALGADEAEQSISNEESAAGDADDRVQKLVKEGAADRKAEAMRLAAALKPLIEAEFDERAENAGLESAMNEVMEDPLPKDEWDYIEKLNHERSVLQIYVSGHPLDKDAAKWSRYVHRGFGDLNADDIGETMRFVGAVVERKDITTKRGDYMCIATLEDLTGSQSVTFFPKTVQDLELRALLDVGTVVVVHATVEEDTFGGGGGGGADDDAGDGAEESAGEVAVKLLAVGPPKLWQPDKIDAEPTNDGPFRRPSGGEVPPAPATPAAPAAPKSAAAAPDQVTLRIPEELFNPDWVNRLRAVCSEHPGATSVRLAVGEKTYRLTQAGSKEPMLVGPNGMLRDQIKQLISATSQTAA